MVEIRLNGDIGNMMDANRLEAFSDGVIAIIIIVAAWLVSAKIGVAFFVFVALMWLVPDRRLARLMTRRHNG